MQPILEVENACRSHRYESESFGSIDKASICHLGPGLSAVMRSVLVLAMVRTQMAQLCGGQTSSDTDVEKRCVEKEGGVVVK